MLVHDDFIFIFLQKTGTTFLEKFLLSIFPNCEKKFGKHDPVSKVVNIIKNRKVLGTVRNPWDWYVSWWSSHRYATLALFPAIFIPENNKDFNKFIKFIMTEDFGVSHGLDPRSLLDQDIGVYTFRHDHCFLDGQGNNRLTHVLHTENLKNDLVSALDLNKKNIDKLFKMDKVHVSKHEHYRTYYNDESIELVAQKDRKIVETYGYDYM